MSGLGREFVEDLTGAPIDRSGASWVADVEDELVDVHAELLESGLFGDWTGLPTWTFDLDAGVWAVLDPNALVENMVCWVDAYKAERGWR